MGVGREYKLTVTTNGKVVDVVTARKLHSILLVLLNKLYVINALDSYDKGTFIQTQNTFTKELLYKRYTIITMIPHTVFEVKKMSKGSLNQDEVIETLRYLKENYYE